MSPFPRGAALRRCAVGRGALAWLGWLVVADLAAAAPTTAAPTTAAPTTASQPAAPSPRVVVRIESCEGLAQAEVGRLLDLELATVTTELRSGPPLQVQLRCVGERLTIAVTDPLTRKQLVRDVPAPAREPGRERVVALAVSGLFAASWLELLSATEPPAPPRDDPTPPPAPTAVEAARRVAERSTELPTGDASPTRPPRAELELLVGLGARGRALERDGRLGAGRLELMLRGWPRSGLGGSAGWVVHAGWDVAQGTRRQGRVRGHAFTAGGGLAWSAPSRRIGLGGHVLVAGGVARIRGVPGEPGVPAASSAGLTAEACTGLGPRVRYGRLRFDLDAELGAMLRSPLGTVDGGREPPMTMGGLWAGVVLRLGGSLR